MRWGDPPSIRIESRIRGSQGRWEARIAYVKIQSRFDIAAFRDRDIQGGGRNRRSDHVGPVTPDPPNTDPTTADVSGSAPTTDQRGL